MALASALLALAVAWALPTFASNGRDFAGTYQIKSLSRQSDKVTVSVTIRFWNYGDSAVTNAKVYLADRFILGKNNGAFSQSVSLQKRQSTDLSDTFTIPASEYAMWRQGLSPLFTVSFKDASGKQVERKIELQLMPTAEVK
jgi:hypothetical protein